MASAGSIVVDLLMRTGSFETDTDRATKRAVKQFRDMERQAKETASAINRSIGGVLSGALFGIGVSSIFSKFVTETRSAQDEQAQLGAVLRSTGEAAGWSIGQLNSMASSLSGVFSEGDINRAQTRLLSYTGVVGEQFPRALQALLDMSARTGMAVEQSAETVGRALDVPSQGLSALSRQGFRFSDEQKKLVERLEQTGRVAQAQDVVLGALESAYGGAASAARETFGGALQALQNQIDSLMTGDEGTVGGLTRSVNDLSDVLGSPETKQAFADFVTLLADVSRAIVGAANDFAEGMRAAEGFFDAVLTYGLTNPFNSNAENAAKYREELQDLYAWQKRVRESGGTTDAIDNKIRITRNRITYFDRRSGNDFDDVVRAYRDVGETGRENNEPVATMPAIAVSGSSKKGGKSRVDEGQRLIDQMEKRIALIGRETEYEKLLEQISIGAITFRTQAQKDDALAAAQTLDFLVEQNKAYEDTQKHLEALSKVTQDTGREMDEFSREAARGIQRSLGDGLYDTLSGRFDDIGKNFADMLLRMAADAAAADLARAAFGDFGRTGRWGGVVGNLLGAFSGPIGVSGSLAQGGSAIGAWDGLMRAYDVGGYTGSGGRLEPAGVVHKGEYVFDARSTQRLGVGFLESLRGYADGGFVGSSSVDPVSQRTGPRVEIVNNGTPQRVVSTTSFFDARGEVISILVDDIKKNGRAARAIQSMGRG
ncbi:putative prophage tail length tape measure protein [Bordetella bronchiseptica GA96-01]|uniref:phage tail length tape measure family protein n=1 Tax=Bordetella bronchiseptica TaxID=518 RepID=UPI00045A6005|nr:phage tail length tape measure family protein [Bordetella bronchiseptica]AZW31501.1 hypothetical protein CS343_15140 [Bordetella bronchiseptica]KCV40741.1 putative prophage tail length tape measure protein [Bordetella bronchiseptica 345]KDC42119.1 putative prophage tail length tape measure protein [Bordetella bronchiseptica GA96-01]